MRFLRIRMIHTSTAVYGIVAGGSREFLKSADVTRFLESFKTWDDPPRQPPSGADRVKGWIEQLQSAEDFERLIAMRELAKLGAEAKDAISRLEKLACDGIPEERDYAKLVLPSIRRAIASAPAANQKVAAPICEILFLAQPTASKKEKFAESWNAKVGI